MGALSAPDWIRTSDRPLRRRVLYPTELQALWNELLTAARCKVKIRVTRERLFSAP